MSTIIGLQSVPDEQLMLELRSGGRLVVYEYCISILVMSFKAAPTSIHPLERIEPGERLAVLPDLVAAGVVGSSVRTDLDDLHALSESQRRA